LLKLREQALVEKTKAELAWLEQQKQKSQKGCDDSYPAIRQKQKEVLEKHKKEEVINSLFVQNPILSVCNGKPM